MSINLEKRIKISFHLNPYYYYLKFKNYAKLLTFEKIDEIYFAKHFMNNFIL